MQWQQVYFLLTAGLSIIANLIYIGYSKSFQPIITISIVIWTFYVLYSAGFYKGLLY